MYLLNRLQLASYLLIFVIITACILPGCSSNNSSTSDEKTAGIVLPPPPGKSPSRPSQPAPETNQPTLQQPSASGAFAPHPAMENTINSVISSSLFPFSFERPGEMAPPRQLVFSGILNTSLDTIDFPAFELQLWSNQQQQTEPVAVFQIPFEKEMSNAYSFQMQTTDAIPSGLYYYLLKDETDKVYYADKVIVDY